MASGVIAIAHDSGGPKSDIVITEGADRTGFLASKAQEYADAMQRILAPESMPGPPTPVPAMQKAARRRAELFSDQEFARSVKRLLPLICQPLPGSIEH